MSFYYPEWARDREQYLQEQIERLELSVNLLESSNKSLERAFRYYKGEYDKLRPPKKTLKEMLAEGGDSEGDSNPAVP